jgi:hypothetical protein
MAKGSGKAGSAKKRIISSSDNGEGSKPSIINSSPPAGAQALYDNDADEASELSSHDGSEHSEDDEEDEGNDAPLPNDAFETAADDAPPTSEDGSEDDNASLPVNPFERAANRSASHGATLGDDEDESSESDSEDIIVAPRTSQYKSADTKNTQQARSSIIDSGYQHVQSSSSLPNSAEVDKEDERQPHGSSSDLSELGATPEPPDTELRRLARQQRRRVLDLCNCEGWCSCERYKIFFGLGNEEQSPVVGSVSSTPDGQKVGAAAKKRPTSGTDADDEADEDVFGNPSSSRNDILSNANKQAGAPEGSDLDFPSQTHLSERVLASEKFSESAMRSTVDLDEKGKGKRRNYFGDEPSRKRTRTKQIFPWDRVAKPSRPPTGWSGGEWVTKATSPVREIQDSEDEEADGEVHT